MHIEERFAGNMSKITHIDNNTLSVQYLCHKDKRLAKLISMVGPISYVVHDEDPYIFLLHEIIEQMLSVKAGNAIFQRLVNICEGEVSPSVIKALSDEQIKSIGTSSNKIKCIREITKAVLNNSLDFHSFETASDIDVLVCSIT